jgi:hypothetical protein
MRGLIAHSFYGESHAEPPLIANPASLVPQAFQRCSLLDTKITKVLCVLTYGKSKSLRLIAAPSHRLHPLREGFVHRVLGVGSSVCVFVIRRCAEHLAHRRRGFVALARLRLVDDDSEGLARFRPRDFVQQ